VADPGATSMLYDVLVIRAGLSRPVTVDDPRVATDVLVRSDGGQLAWLASHPLTPRCGTAALDAIDAIGPAWGHGRRLGNH
jgi:hypothetical protein